MKSLLVQMDGTPRCAERLRMAIDLARTLDAHLTALLATSSPLMDAPYALAAAGLSQNLLLDVYADWRRQAAATFEAARTGPEVSWAELGDGPIVTDFASQALYADLLVLGQREVGEADRQLPRDFVPAVLVTSGRPALVLPHSGNFAGNFSKVLVAWTPTAPAVRALNAAMPFLRRASEVTVVEWGYQPPSFKGQPLDVARYLALHGVKTRLDRSPALPSGDVGERLLSKASDIGADLLVMGCYGHSRTHEFVLGGATRTVLASMTLPVLMSH